MRRAHLQRWAVEGGQQEGEAQRPVSPRWLQVRGSQTSQQQVSGGRDEGGRPVSGPPLTEPCGFDIPQARTKPELRAPRGSCWGSQILRGLPTPCFGTSGMWCLFQWLVLRFAAVTCRSRRYVPSSHRTGGSAKPAAFPFLSPDACQQPGREWQRWQP